MPRTRGVFRHRCAAECGPNAHDADVRRKFNIPKHFYRVHHSSLRLEKIYRQDGD